MVYAVVFVPQVLKRSASYAGLVCLELYKVVQDVPIEKYRNTFANLALPLFAMSEPVDSQVCAFPVPSSLHLLGCCSAFLASAWFALLLHRIINTPCGLVFDWSTAVF